MNVSFHFQNNWRNKSYLVLHYMKVSANHPSHAFWFPSPFSQLSGEVAGIKWNLWETSLRANVQSVSKASFKWNKLFLWHTDDKKVFSLFVSVIFHCNTHFWSRFPYRTICTWGSHRPRWTFISCCTSWSNFPWCTLKCKHKQVNSIRMPIPIKAIFTQQGNHEITLCHHLRSAFWLSKISKMVGSGCLPGISNTNQLYSLFSTSILSAHFIL